MNVQAAYLVGWTLTVVGAVGFAVASHYGQWWPVLAAALWVVLLVTFRRAV